MLHVILLILKIIGIILLTILGLLLSIILIVLLVPIQYKANVEHGDDLLMVNAKANWLLHILNARITHLEGILHIRVRVLWFTLYDNLNTKKPKDKTKRTVRIKRSKADKKKTKLIDDNYKKIETSEIERKEVIFRDRESKNTTQTKSNNDIKSNAEIKSNTEIKSDTEIKSNLTMKKSNTITEADEKKEKNTSIDTKIGTTPEEDNNTKQNSNIIYERLQNNVIKSQSQFTVKEEEKSQPDKGIIDQKKKTNVYEKLLIKIKVIWKKIINFKDKLLSIKDKIKSFFVKLKEKLISIEKTAKNIKHKMDLILSFLKDELNKQGIRITYESIKKLLKHILPRKLKSRIVYGTGDPCSTGQTLGAMSILYSFYGDKIQIIPDFENKVFEGQHYARGRIRLITLLIIVIKLILDKRFQNLKKNFQILKEAL